MTAIDLTAEIDNEEIIRKFREMKEAVRRATSSVVTDSDRMDMAIRRFGNNLAKLGVGISLGHLVRQVAQTRGEFQQLEVAFTTLLQSKEKADALMAQMVDLAAKTPFDLQGVASGARQLLAYGFAAEDITDTLTRLGNVAAGLGLSLQDLTWLYGTTAVQGRLFTRDVMQFQSRGIDIAGELATMLGKTRAEINQMVTEGKIGFPEVQKAFERMTDQGGKFYNLMEEQSKTITGLISNLGDAIDTMFNEIGKSQEGVITTVLQGTISLVENYEKVLNILLPLVAAYGTYKVALMAIAALDRVKATVAASKAILEHTKMLRRATQAQILFNQAVKANPLGLALSLLALIGTAVWEYASGAEEAAENTIGLARANKKASEEVDGEIARIKSLQDVLNNSNNAYSERKKALNELKSIAPNYHADLTSEGELINNNTDALKNYIKEFEKSVKLQAAKDELQEAYKQQRQQQKTYDAARQKLSGMQTNSAYSQTPIIDVAGWLGMRDIQKAQDELHKAETELEATSSIIAALNNEIAQSSALVNNNANDTITSAAENLKTAQQGYDKAVKEWQEAIKQGKDVSVVKEKQGEVETAKKTLDDAKKLAGVDDKTISSITKAQGKLSDSLLQADLDLQKSRIAIMRDGRNKRLAEADLEYQQTAIAINKKRKEAVDGGKTKDELSVYDNQLKTAEQKRLQDRRRIEKEYAQEVVESYLRLGDVFVSEEERKTRAAEKTYQAMRDKALEDLQAGSISGSDFVLLNAQIDNAEAYEQMQDLVDAFGNTQDKITRIQKTAQEARDKAIKNNRQDLLPQIDKQEQEEISKIELDELMNSDDWVNLFQNLDVLSQKKIHEIIDRINEQLKNAKLSPIDLKTVTDQIDKAEDTARSKNPFTALARGIPKLKSALATAKKAWADYEKAKGTPDEANARVAAEQAQIEADKTRLETWQDAQKGAADLSKTMGAVGDMLGKFGVQVPQEMEGVMGALDAFASMDLTRPFSIVTGAIQGVASLIGGIFGNKSYLIPQEVFDQYDTFIDVLDKVIDREKELIETVAGAQAVMASDEALKAIEKQEDATRRLAKAYLASREKGKKSYGVRTERELRGYKDEIEAAGFNWKKLYGTGRMEGLFDMSAEDIKDFQKRLPEVWAHLDEKTREYLETIVECGEKTEEVEAALKEAATGITFDGLKSELLDFLNDMDSTFDDVAGNFEDTMTNAINRVIATQMDGRLKEWYDHFSQAMDDGVLSEVEREKLKREYENIYADALRDREQMNSIAGINPDTGIQQEASSKGFQTMSQDTGNELNGRFTAIQENTTFIKNTLELMRSQNAEKLNMVTDIRDIAIQLNGNVADIRGFSQVLPEMANDITSMKNILKNRL